MYCYNCGGWLRDSAQTCDRCHGNQASRTGETVRFTEEAREAAYPLGGLLELLPADGAVVKFIGFCAAGGLGISADGRLIWIEDLIFISTAGWRDGVFYLGTRATDVDTGGFLGPKR